MRPLVAFQSLVLFCIAASLPAMAAGQSMVERDQQLAASQDLTLPSRLADSMGGKEASMAYDAPILVKRGGHDTNDNDDEPRRNKPHARPRPRPGPNRTPVHSNHYPKHGKPHRPSPTVAPPVSHRPPKPHKPTKTKKPEHPKPTQKPNKPHKPHKPNKPHKPHKPHKPTKKPQKPTKTRKPRPEPTETREPNPQPTTTAPLVLPPSQTTGPDTNTPVDPVQPPSATTTTLAEPQVTLPSPSSSSPSSIGGVISSPQPTSPPTLQAPTQKTSGDNNSSLPSIIGAVVGVIALVGLFALVAYRRRERARARADNAESNPEMDEAPRTAFRHESFMALVKDAAQGFYAPTAAGAGASAAAGATTIAAEGQGAALTRQYSQNSQRSVHSDSNRSLNYLDTGSPTSPANAHLSPRA